MPSPFRARLAVRLERQLVRADNGCLEWTGARTPDGYGVIQRGPVSEGRVGAHRAAYELAHGVTLPPGIVVRHTCDNPPCCDPAHLLSGTVRDNAADAVERGLIVTLRGEEHANHVLTAADVTAIRARAAAGESQGSLARAYGVNQSTVSKIVRGLARKWG